jgi:flagellin-like protein
VFEIMAFTKNEEAVSPVIGVILMVAITVILAAVIAAFVFGMAGNIQKTRVVAATASHIGTNIQVTWKGGQDNGAVTSYNVSINGVLFLTNPAGGFPPNVGNSTSFSANVNNGSQNHVVVAATFNDGSQQVILDSYV